MIIGSIDNILINLSEQENLKEFMKISESTFSEWDNEDDEIYDTLCDHDRTGYSSWAI